MTFPAGTTLFPERVGLATLPLPPSSSLDPTARLPLAANPYRLATGQVKRSPPVETGSLLDSGAAEVPVLAFGGEASIDASG